MDADKNELISSIVTRNPESAAIFNYYGIDFFSRGNRSLEHASIDENAPLSLILEELTDLKEKPFNRDLAKMNPVQLSDYIIKNHHAYTEEKLVYIKHTLERLCVEFQNVKSLQEIKKCFGDLSANLTIHLKYEEFVLFPFIKKVVRKKNLSSRTSNVAHPIEAMRNDHDHEMFMFKNLAKLTNNYTLPPNADYALKMSYKAMKELEDDLKIHMHLENNLLFPKTIELATTRKEISGLSTA